MAPKVEELERGRPCPRVVDQMPRGFLIPPVFLKQALTGFQTRRLLQVMAKDFSDLERRCLEVLLKQNGDVAHDLGHVRRVVGNARQLAIREGARLSVVLPAAWLHDCVVVPKDSPRRKQASQDAAKQAAQWLQDWGYAEELLPDIAHAIEAHSFSAAIQPRTIEAKVVQDADRLEAIGAVGLARCLMLSGAMGHSLYVESDPFCENRVADDRLSAVDHFFTKLMKIETLMQTESGRTEARQRTKFLQSFLDELRREIAMH
jgi:uncharacterized protein